MLLSDKDLLDSVKSGRLGITPFDASLIQPASIEMRLGSTFQVFRGSRDGLINLEARSGAQWEEVQVGPESLIGDSFVLQPGVLVLATTQERVTLNADLAARLEGKSSLGRLGLLTHVTAGFIDPGFDGQITLELKNMIGVPLLLKPGMRIGQLCVFQMTSPAARPYGWEGLGSHYQGQRGPTQARA